MKRILSSVFVAVLSLGMIATDAEARRLGGGRSTGMQRDSSVMKRDTTPSQSAAPAQAAPAPAGAPAASGAGRWMGPLAGLAAGIGLAALLSHFGMGEEFASIMMMMLLAAVAFFVIRRLFFRAQPSAAPLQYSGAGAGGGVSSIQPQMSQAPATTGVSMLAGFDSEGFLRQAKLNFIRLQAANDAGNIEDIREFTTPEMFAEIKLQMQERGAQAQQTDVVTLNAAMLDISQKDQLYLASVRFTGVIRESADGAAESLDEVWHLSKPADGSRGWQIAGIQQMQ